MLLSDPDPFLVGACGGRLARDAAFRFWNTAWGGTPGGLQEEAVSDLKHTLGRPPESVSY